MRIVTQLVAWFILPMMATLLVVSLWQVSASYQAVNQGHALQAPAADCVTSPDEFFNDCAVLDTTQVQDLRTGWDEKLCDANGARCWIEHHTDDTELEIP